MTDPKELLHLTPGWPAPAHSGLRQNGRGALNSVIEDGDPSPQTRPLRQPQTLPEIDAGRGKDPSPTEGAQNQDRSPESVPVEHG